MHFVGHVMEGFDQSPVSQARLSFGKRGLEPVVTHTDRTGDFELALDPRAWRVGDSCRVAVSAEDGRELLATVVGLRQGLTFVVESSLTLRGRVEVPAQAWGRIRAVGVKALAGYPGSSAPRHWGRASVQADGEFFIPVLAHRDSVPSEFVLVFELMGGQGEEGLVTRHGVSRDALLSEEGARVSLDWNSLICLVLDEKGAPIEGAQVSCGPPDGWEVVSASTDREGRAALLVPVTATEICVGAPGYASVQDRVAETGPGGGRRTYELVSLDERSEITGVVLFDDGEAVHDAFVSAMPVCGNSEVALAGFVSARSDRTGAFHLRASGGQGGLVRVQAYHRRSGMSDQLDFVPDGREVVLTIERRGWVVVEFEFLDPPSVVRGSGVEYLLVNEESGRHVAGQTSGTSAQIEEVSPGRYQLYLFSSGMDAYGEASLEVAGGETTHCDVGMRTASWIHGRVVGPESRPVQGLRVEIGDEGWPRAVVEWRGWSVTDSDGRFRLLAGQRRRVTLEVEDREPLFLCTAATENVLEIQSEDPGR